MHPTIYFMDFCLSRKFDIIYHMTPITMLPLVSILQADFQEV